MVHRSPDLLAIPQSSDVPDLGKAPEKTVDGGITTNVDDEDEPDRWKFDAGDDDVDASIENGEYKTNTVDDACNNFEDLVEETESAEGFFNAFPYGGSKITDLRDIIKEIIQEGNNARNSMSQIGAMSHLLSSRHCEAIQAIVKGYIKIVVVPGRLSVNFHDTQ